MPVPRSVLKRFRFRLLPLSFRSCRGDQTHIFISSVTEVNERCCTSNATICLHDKERENFTLFPNGSFLSTGHFSVLWGLLHLMFMKLVYWCFLYTLAICPAGGWSVSHCGKCIAVWIFRRLWVTSLYHHIPLPECPQHRVIQIFVYIFQVFCFLQFLLPNAYITRILARVPLIPLNVNL